MHDWGVVWRWWSDGGTPPSLGFESETVDECMAVISGEERWFGVASDGGKEGP